MKLSSIANVTDVRHLIGTTTGELALDIIGPGVNEKRGDIRSALVLCVAVRGVEKNHSTFHFKTSFADQNHGHVDQIGCYTRICSRYEGAALDKLFSPDKEQCCQCYASEGAWSTL